MKALIQENVPLAPFTTFDIGGPARYFLDASTEAMVLEGIGFARLHKLPIFILGGGSNLLVADAGFPGLVLKIGIGGIDWSPSGDRTIVLAGAGEDWDRLVELAVEKNLAGVECLSGIPGSVGGTPVQNVGAYGQEVSETLSSVRAYDLQTGSIVELTRDECRFAYRSSIFNSAARDRFVVLQVTYSLSQSRPPFIRYPDLQKEFEGRTSPPSLAEVRAAVRRIRARKAMLITQNDPDCRSAGSFFKNPIVTEQDYFDLQSRTGPNIPHYPAASGKVKIPAAWLIERSGFSKGYQLGKVGLSSKHTLALVNRGGAKAEDVLRLARTIREGVRARFDVRLVPEPVFLGFDTSTYSEFFTGS